jgi:hypothetical protein
LVEVWLSDLQRVSMMARRLVAAWASLLELHLLVLMKAFASAAV